MRPLWGEGWPVWTSKGGLLQVWPVWVAKGWLFKVWPVWTAERGLLKVWPRPWVSKVNKGTHRSRRLPGRYGLFDFDENQIEDGEDGDDDDDDDDEDETDDLGGLG